MVEVEMQVVKDPMDEVAYTSDEEKDIKEEKEKPETKFNFDQKAQPVGELKTLLVVNTKHAGALAQIVFNEEAAKGSKAKVELGILKAMKEKKEEDKEKEVDDGKEKEILKFFQIKDSDILLVEIQEKFGGGHSYKSCQVIFEKFPQIGRTIFLHDQHKNLHSTEQGTYQGEPGVLMTYSSSFVTQDQQLDSFRKSKGTFAQPLNFLRGFPAELLMQAEYSGKAAIVFVLITDSHEVQTETLQGYAPVVNELLGQAVDFDSLWQMPKFKSVLKEINNKGHNIFN